MAAAGNIAATSNRFCSSCQKEDQIRKIGVICFPFFQMASIDGNSCIFAATSHGSDVVHVIPQQDGHSAVPDEATASAVVTVGSTEVASAVHAPSASLHASQVSSQHLFTILHSSSLSECSDHRRCSQQHFHRRPGRSGRFILVLILINSLQIPRCRSADRLRW